MRRTQDSGEIRFGPQDFGRVENEHDKQIIAKTMLGKTTAGGDAEELLLVSEVSTLINRGTPMDQTYFTSMGKRIDRRHLALLQPAQPTRRN